MIDYPTEEDIAELNKEILKTIKVRKADTHRVIRRGGDLYDKAATLYHACARSSI